MTEYKYFADMNSDRTDNQILTVLSSKELNHKQKEILTRYYGYLQRQGVKKGTQAKDLFDFKQVLLDLNKDFEELTQQDIDAFLIRLDQKYKPSTVFYRRVALIKFLCWYFNKPQDQIEIIRELKLKKNYSAKLPEEILTPDEIKKLVQVAENFRDKAIAILLYETGARKGEFLQLRVKHIEILNSAYGYITIPQGKTTSRKVPLVYSLPHMTNWLNSHPKRDDPNAPLFVNQNLKKEEYVGLGMDNLRRILEDLRRKAGVQKKVYPHMFRHSRMTELAKELTEQELKIFAGWTPNSHMASIYVHLSGSDVSNKILAKAGLLDVQDYKKGCDVLKGLVCPRCQKLNPADSKFCSCGLCLDLREANKMLELRDRTADAVDSFFEPRSVQDLFKLVYKLQQQITKLESKD